MKKKTVKAWAVVYSEGITVHTRKMNENPYWFFTITETKKAAVIANGGSTKGVVPVTITY